MNWAVWGPSIVVMTAGLLVGLIVVLRSKGHVRTDTTVDLWAKKDSLVDQLRALQADKDKLDPHEWQHRWIRLLDEAAAALRDAEQVGSAPPSLPEKPVPEAASPSTRWAWIAVVTLFFVGLGAALNTATQQREEGGIMTGGALITGTPIEQTIQELEEQAQAEPKAIGPRNQLAHIAIQRGDMSSAMRWIDEARAIDPQHPDLRINLAILQISIGMVERAKTELDAALEDKPQSSKALLWRGIIDMRLNQREKAIQRLESALENATNREERMMASSALSEARKPPPTVQIQGTILLESGVDTPKNGVLFVMVRRTAEGKGPPVAALRLSPSGIPGAFAVTDRDMMMGGPWPDQVWVSARVDTDGNPTTKAATDLLSNTAGPFSSGSTDVELVLQGSATTEESPPTSGIHLSGTIALAEGLSVSDGGAIFIIVRSSPTKAGPPLAAVKLDPSALPTAFSIGDKDIMMGGPWPEKVWLTARTDNDGNAMTRDEQDATTQVMGPLASGTNEIELLLGGD